MSNRVHVTWRGPGGLRQDKASTVRDFPELVELLASGPAGWSVAVVALFNEEPHVVDKFAVWRRQLENCVAGEAPSC